MLQKDQFQWVITFRFIPLMNLFHFDSQKESFRSDPKVHFDWSMWLLSEIRIKLNNCMQWFGRIYSTIEEGKCVSWRCSMHGSIHQYGISKNMLVNIMHLKLWKVKITQSFSKELKWHYTYTEKVRSSLPDVFCGQVFLKSSQNLQEKVCARISFFSRCSDFYCAVAINTIFIKKTKFKITYS